MVGVPEKEPVEVLKLIPAGAAGEIAKLAIAPPVDFTKNPVATELLVRDSEVELNVNAGTASAATTVNE